MNLRTLYANGMADALNISASELYDWERNIKEDGQFSGTRSGPGGGTPATPANVALLLTAILGSSTKRNAGRRAKLLGAGATYIPPNGNAHDDHYNHPHRGTGQRSFMDALTVLLALPKTAVDIDQIEFDVDINTITIRTRFELDGKIYTPSDRFAFPNADDAEVPPVRTVRILTGKALRSIANAMSENADDQDTDSMSHTG